MGLFFYFCTGVIIGTFLLSFYAMIRNIKTLYINFLLLSAVETLISLIAGIINFIVALFFYLLQSALLVIYLVHYLESERILFPTLILFSIVLYTILIIKTPHIAIQHSKPFVVTTYATLPGY